MWVSGWAIQGKGKGEKEEVEEYSNLWEDHVHRSYGWRQHGAYEGLNSKAIVEEQREWRREGWEDKEKVGACYESITGHLKDCFLQLKRHWFLGGKEG